MTVLTNQAMLDAFSLLNMQLRDNLVGIAATSSNLTGTATRVTGSLVRFTGTFPATSPGVGVLPSLLTGEANYPVVVVNSSTQAITIYPYGDSIGTTHAESLNGTASTFGGATGGLSIPANQSAIFIPVDTPKGRGGVPTTSQLNWAAAVYP